MKSDLEQFENRSDDWLAKQRQHETRVSAWDFDEGKKLKMEHEIRHQAYNQMQNIRQSRIEEHGYEKERKNNYNYLSKSQNVGKKNAKTVSIVISIITGFYIMLVLGFILFQ